MHLFFAPDIALTPELPQEEAQHAVRVLRLTEGDHITLTDGKGFFYDAVIDMATQKRCTFSILSQRPQPELWRDRIHLAVAPTKNMDRMEWLAEKATEIGIDGLTFLDCDFSERRVIKTERIEKIVVSAMKQSLKARMPRIEGIVSFKEFIRKDFKGQKFIAHCHETDRRELKDHIQSTGDVLILIGPEGDFSKEEVSLALEAGFLPVSLGPSRLRTETAALVACHLMNLSKQ